MEQELYPASACNTENVNYADSITSILELHGCIGCHSDLLASGGVNLSNYQDVKIYVDNGRLLGSIKHEDGFSAMPQGAPKIPDCDIAKIEAWVAEGAPNN